ncbi:hypothetical protein BLOT_012398 [Blomia tropicalis]|nr:hypothetical protein BLOT_012398 [Blomia tropicalis]
MDFKIKIESKFTLDEVKLFVTTITINQETYLFPEHLQHIELHEQLATLQEVEVVLNTLSDKPNQFRYVNVTLYSPMLELYWIKGNIVFNSFALQQLESQQSMPSTMELLALVNRLQDELKQKSKLPIHEVKKHFMLTPFDGKSNVSFFMEKFELECSKFNIKNDDEKIEALRVFMTSSALHWYDSNLVRIGKRDWTSWMESMKSVFGNRNWAHIRHAYNFRYLTGRYVDYVLQKQKLILDVNEKIRSDVLINIIVIGLPIETQNKLDQDKLTSIEKLVEELAKHEQDGNPSSSKTSIQKKPTDKVISKVKTGGNKPCSYCSKRNFTRFHPEDSCWFKETRVNLVTPEFELEELDDSKN